MKTNSRRHWRTSLACTCLSFALSSACTTASEVVDDAGMQGSSDTSGAIECRDETTPERFIVFGDSILACSTVTGRKDDPECSAKLVHEHLVSRFGAHITYENAAIGGSVTADVPMQMKGVDATPSAHAVVLVGIGGNDLAEFLLASDEAAMSAFDDLSERLDASWNEIFAWLLDEKHFPAGFTLVVDNQYNPFDDCSADPYVFMSPLKTELLATFNRDIAARLEGHDNARLSDLHRAFLGHGHHYKTAECPHTKEGAEYWMIGGSDLIHPGTPGHAAIAVEVQAALDDLYVGCSD